VGTARVDPVCGAVLGSIFADAPEATIRAALLGRGIVQSRTPQMHISEGDRLGLSYAYRLIDFDKLHLDGSALCPMIRAAALFGLAGLNVTHPFKQAVLGCLDELSANAAAIGAVNTVVLRGGKAIGHNTDCWGFAESFRREMPGASLDRVLLIGAGGAGKAVGRALFDLGASEVVIADLDFERAASLARSLQQQLGEGRAAAISDVREASRRSNGLVNTTPVGMANYPGMPAPPDVLRQDLWVSDVIYFPAETELLRAASAAGSRTMGGRGMAIFQAVRAFELITGRAPDPEEMARHFARTDS
jgi:shikimate dehydrogenase